MRALLVMPSWRIVVLFLLCVPLAACGKKPLLANQVVALPDGDAIVLFVGLDSEGHPNKGGIMLVTPDGPRWSWGEPASEVWSGNLERPFIAADARYVFSLALQRHTGNSLDSGGRVVKARHRSDGKVAWSVELPKGPVSGTGGDIGTTLVADGDALVVAGQTELPTESEGDPMGTLIVSLDAASGRERWRLERTTPLAGEVYVGDKTIVAKSGDAWLWIDKAGGRELKTAAFDRACRSGETLIGVRAEERTLVAVPFDAALPERPIALGEGFVPDLAGLFGATMVCVARKAADDRVLVLGDNVVTAIDLGAARVAWQATVGGRLGMQLPVAPTGSAGVMHFATLIQFRDKPAEEVWTTLDTVTGRVSRGATSASRVGTINVPGASLLFDFFDRYAATDEKDAPESARLAVYGDDGKPLAAWRGTPSHVDVLRPWSAAGGKLWLLREERVSDREDASWAVVDLATGKIVGQHGEPGLEPLGDAERDRWIAGQP